MTDSRSRGYYIIINDIYLYRKPVRYDRTSNIITLDTYIHSKLNPIALLHACIIIKLETLKSYSYEFDSRND